jgi:filamentous hemagglutinin family protein
MIRKRQWKDPNTKKNRMKNIESENFIEDRWKIFNEVKANGGSDIQGIIKALEIIPKLDKQPKQKARRRSK